MPNVLTLGDPLCADLDLRLAEGLHHGLRVDAAEGGRLAGDLWGVWLALLIPPLLLELHLAHGHDGGGELVAVPLFLLREAEDIEGVISVLELLIVINGRNSGLTLTDIRIEVDVIAKKTFALQIRDEGLEKLIEDVIGPLYLLLLRDS